MLLKAGRGPGILQGLIRNGRHATAERLQCNSVGIDLRWPSRGSSFWPIDYDTNWSTLPLCSAATVDIRDEISGLSNHCTVVRRKGGGRIVIIKTNCHSSSLTRQTRSELSINTTGGQATVIIDQMKGWGGRPKENRQWRVSHQMVKASTTTASEFNSSILLIQLIRCALVLDGYIILMMQREKKLKNP